MNVTDQAICLGSLKDAIVRVSGSRQTPVLVLGAGASMPYLPMADTLKEEILHHLALMTRPAYEDLDEIIEVVRKPHINLEVFCSMLRYRCERFRPIGLWNNLCTGIPLNSLSQAIAILRQASLIGPILTTNFDRMIPHALEWLGAEHGRDFRFVTEWQFGSSDEDEAPTETDVCALHGTVYRLEEGFLAPPLSVTARGLARPFPPGLYRYLWTLFRSDRPVLVIGYSGQDHYDMNLFLADLRMSSPAALSKWTWVSYSGDEREIQRVSRLIDRDQIVVGDATRVLLQLCDRLGLGPRDWQRLRSEEDRVREVTTWKRNMARTIDEFELPAEGVTNFVQDLRVNLPGAWVVLEHYRLFSAGYEEGSTLTFGGVQLPDSTSANNSDVAHLTYLRKPWEVRLGQLLDGQFQYWLEDRSYRERQDQVESGSAYPRSSTILEDILARIRKVLDQIPDNRLRPEDRALLLIGMAIAEDYLGLINRKRSMLCPAQGQRFRDRALTHFEACRSLAHAAGEILSEERRSQTGRAFGTGAMDDLVQYRTWELIGQTNIARTLKRDQAVPVYQEVIALMQHMIEQERAETSNDQEPSAHNDYLLAYYPQLWLRSSELLKTILYCQGNTEQPCVWDRLTVPERQLAEKVVNICEEAYLEYSRLVSYANSRYPAYYEAVILLNAARAASKVSVTEGERYVALDRATQSGERVPSARGALPQRPA